MTKESTADSVVAGSAVGEHVAAVRAYAEAGYDEVHVSNMGPHYREMIEFYGEQVLPGVRRSTSAAD